MFDITIIKKVIIGIFKNILYKQPIILNFSAKIFNFKLNIFYQ